MKNIFILLFTFFSFSGYTQNKLEYLKNNRFDLNSSEFNFPDKQFYIIGFGGYHGSSKIEDVEIELLTSLTKNKSIKYYLPETDYSIAHY